MVAGSNVTLTPDATNDKVTIAATDTTYSEVGADKTKLNGIADGEVGPKTWKKLYEDVF